MTGATILLVDEDRTLRRACRKAFESAGNSVVEAGDGQTALHLVQEWLGPLDLVITDLSMPRLGGRELAEVLGIFLPDLPVLGMTADPGKADRRLPTLLKPFSMDHLLEVARLMQSRTVEMRINAQEQRTRAREARRIAAEQLASASAMRQRVDLVSVALELLRLGQLNRRP